MEIGADEPKFKASVQEARWLARELLLMGNASRIIDRLEERGPKSLGITPLITSPARTARQLDRCLRLHSNHRAQARLPEPHAKSAAIRPEVTTPAVQLPANSKYARFRLSKQTVVDLCYNPRTRAAALAAYLNK